MSAQRGRTGEMRVCDVLPTRDSSYPFILSLAFPHPESLHPAGDPQPSPAGAPTWSVTGVDSAGSFPRSAGAPWLQPEDDLVDRSLSHWLDGAADAAKLGLNPTPRLVASGDPTL